MGNRISFRYLLISYILVMSIGVFTQSSVYSIESASALSSLSGIIFEDTNGNSHLDLSENGLPDWGIQINGTLSNATAYGPFSITSDIDGLYSFSDLSDGVYELKITDSPLWTNTTQSIIDNLNLESDSNISNDFGLYKLNRIFGFVYNDTNGNAIKDGGDDPVVNWPVHLTINSDTITMMTDETSRYEFNEVEAGNYTLSVDAPSPYVSTEPAIGFYEIETSSGIEYIQDFGLVDNQVTLGEGFGDILTLYTEQLKISQDGHLFAVNSLESIIHKYDLDGNLISTVGGEGTDPGLFTRPTGLAIDSQGNIFVSDRLTYLQKFDSSGNFLFGWGSSGNGTGQFENPRGLAIDSEDNLYVTDGNNYRIQKFDNDGNFLEVISGPGIAFGYLQVPYDVTFDPQGDLFVADTGNDRIQIFDSNGNFKEAIFDADGLGDSFHRPRSVTVDSNNFVYVADTYNNRIQVFDGDKNFVMSFGTLGSAPGEFANPSGLITTSDGKLFVADTSNDRIQVFNSTTANFLYEFPLREPSVEPYFTAFDGFGNLLVADGHNHKIITIDPLTDNILSEFGTLGDDPGELRGPRGIAFDQDDNIYVGDNYNNRVNKYDSSGNFLSSWGVSGNMPGEFSQVRGIGIDSFGDVMVSDTQNDRIQKFDQDGNFISSFDSFLPYQLSLDTQDNIYVAEENADKVTKYNSSGNPLLVIGTPGSDPGELFIPKGVITDSNGNIFVADSGNDRIQKFDSDGNFLAMVGTKGTETSQFSNPRGLTMDSNDNLWVSDTGNFRLQVFDNDLNFIKAVEFPDISPSDEDEDGIIDSIDNCSSIPNPLQEDLDMDDIGDVCDTENLITESKTLTSSHTLIADLIIQDGAVLTVQDGFSVTIPSGSKLLVVSGSGVLIKSGGSLIVVG